MMRCIHFTSILQGKTSLLLSTFAVLSAVLGLHLHLTRCSFCYI